MHPPNTAGKKLEQICTSLRGLFEGVKERRLKTWITPYVLPSWVSYVVAKITRPRTDKLLPRDKAVQGLDLEAEAPFGTWISLILSPSSLFWRSLFVAVVVDFVVVVVFVCCCFCNFFALCLHHFPYFRVLIGFYFILFSLLLCAFHLNIYIYGSLYDLQTLHGVSAMAGSVMC